MVPLQSMFRPDWLILMARCGRPRRRVACPLLKHRAAPRAWRIATQRSRQNRLIWSEYALDEVKQGQLPDGRQCLERGFQCPLIVYQADDGFQGIGIFDIDDTALQETDEIKM